ncbi:MAG: hypothetical protein NVS9B1_23360 [Candidatus Dormibacteraceae bacterium]
MAPGVRSLWYLFRCSHPEPVVVVTLAAGFLGILAGRGTSTGWLVAAVFSGQLAIGWANDYLDRDLDRRLQKTDKPIAAGLVAPAMARNAAIIAAIACIPLSLANGLAAGSEPNARK